MTNPKPDKVAEVEDLAQRLRASAVVILTDYRGLTVSEIGALRARLREASLEYRVAKNTLLGRAADRAGVTGLAPFLTGPTAVVFGRDDPGAPARILQEFIRQYRKLEIKGGVVEGQILGQDGVQSLASLPTRVELVARLIGMIQSPLRGLVTVLTGPQRGLVVALDAVRKQREAADGGTPAQSDVDGAAAAGAEAGTHPVTREVAAGVTPAASGEGPTAPSAGAESGPVTAEAAAPEAGPAGL